MLKLQDLREVIKLIDQSSISEFTYENDGATISIKKSLKIIEESPQQEIRHTKQAVQAPAEEEKQEIVNISIEQSEREVVKDDTIVEIVSPMVGTFYSKPSPESDPYVQIGDKIDDSSIVCIVEAMKLFNEIEAETSGEIVDVLVGDGELVEYGQVLFKVKTR